MDEENFKEASKLIELNYHDYQNLGNDDLKQLIIQWIESVKITDINDSNRLENIKETILRFGENEQKAFFAFNRALKGVLDRQIQDAQGLEDSTQLLKELQLNIYKIKPPKKSFIYKFIDMFKLLFSLKDSSWEMWLESYPLQKEKIGSLINRLTDKKKQLKRHQSILLSDKEKLKNHLHILEVASDVICQIREKSDVVISMDQDLNADIKQFLIEEMIPIIQQKVVEIQQQLLIARQAFMTLELFINQNKSQIGGIDQAINTTTTAMDVTASITVLQHSEQSIHESRSHRNQKRNLTFDKKKLNVARRTIEKALKQLEKSEKMSNCTGESTSQIK